MLCPPLVYQSTTINQQEFSCWLITARVSKREPEKCWHAGSEKRNEMVKNEPLSCPGRRGVTESWRAHHLTPTHSSSSLQTISTEFQNCIKTSLKALSQDGTPGHCVTDIILHLRSDNCKWCHYARENYFQWPWIKMETCICN